MFSTSDTNTKNIENRKFSSTCHAFFMMNREKCKQIYQQQRENTEVVDTIDKVFPNDS